MSLDNPLNPELAFAFGSRNASVAQRVTIPAWQGACKVMTQNIVLLEDARARVREIMKRLQADTAPAEAAELLDEFWRQKARIGRLEPIVEEFFKEYTELKAGESRRDLKKSNAAREEMRAANRHTVRELFKAVLLSPKIRAMTNGRVKAATRALVDKLNADPSPLPFPDTKWTARRIAYARNEQSK
jgi:hypothetical protein